MTREYALAFVDMLEKIYGESYLAASIDQIVEGILPEPNKSAQDVLKYLEAAITHPDRSESYRFYQKRPRPQAVIALVREKSAIDREKESEKLRQENRSKTDQVQKAMQTSAIGKEVEISLARTTALGAGDDVFIEEMRRLHGLFPHSGFDVVAENRRSRVAA